MKICSIYTCKLDLYIWSTHLSSRGGSGNSQARAGGIQGELISSGSSIQIEFQGMVWILRFFCTIVMCLVSFSFSFFASISKFYFGVRVSLFSFFP